MKANLYAAWITGFGTIALFIYWFVFNHTALSNIMYCVIMFGLALLSGNFFGIYNKKRGN